MASPRVLLLSSRLRSRLSPLLRPSAAALLHSSPPHDLLSSAVRDLLLRHLSTAARRHPSTSRPRPVDIGARARQLQNRRLWTYGLTFSCVAGFIVIVLSNFQDQLVFYVTPSDALQRFAANPSKNHFRLGGLVLEGSVLHPSSDSPEMEFVVTDLVTDILVRYEGSLPDLFREGHSAVVEGFLKPFDKGSNEPQPSPRSGGGGVPGVSDKAKSGEYFFNGTEVLAKHDEKYMPKEVAEAIERNKKKIDDEAQGEAAEQNN